MQLRLLLQHWSLSIMIFVCIDLSIRLLGLVFVEHKRIGVACSCSRSDSCYDESRSGHSCFSGCPMELLSPKREYFMTILRAAFSFPASRCSCAPWESFRCSSPLQVIINNYWLSHTGWVRWSKRSTGNNLQSGSEAGVCRTPTKMASSVKILKVPLLCHIHTEMICSSCETSRAVSLALNLNRGRR